MRLNLESREFHVKTYCLIFLALYTRNDLDLVYNAHIQNLESVKFPLFLVKQQLRKICYKRFRVSATSCNLEYK